MKDNKSVFDNNLNIIFHIIPLIILFAEDVPEAVPLLAEDVLEAAPLLASTGSVMSNTEVRSCSNVTDGPIIKQCWFFEFKLCFYSQSLSNF